MVICTKVFTQKWLVILSATNANDKEKEPCAKYYQSAKCYLFVSCAKFVQPCTNGKPYTKVN